MTVEQEYRRINLQLRIWIEGHATRDEIDWLCAFCQDPFRYESATNLQLNWLRVELETRRQN